MSHDSSSIKIEVTAIDSQIVNVAFLHIQNNVLVYYKLGVHDMQQASRKAEPGNYKHAVNDM